MWRSLELKAGGSGLYHRLVNLLLTVLILARFRNASVAFCDIVQHPSI